MINCGSKAKFKYDREHRSPLLMGSSPVDEGVPRRRRPLNLATGENRFPYTMGKGAFKKEMSMSLRELLAKDAPQVHLIGNRESSVFGI